MQFLSVIPEQVESAAQDLAGIRSALSASYAAAAGPTTAVVSAAEDEVSTAIASIFGAYGRQCQGPPRPDLVCWAVPVCNCSGLPFYWLCPPRWVELARSRSQ